MKKKLKYVEFFGAPGVGKSTLYNQCIKKKTSQIKDYKQLRKEWFNSQISNESSCLKRLFLKFSILSNQLNNFLTQSFVQKSEKKFVQKFIECFGEYYLNTIYNINNSKSSEYRKYLANKLVINTITDYSILTSMENDDRLILVDELFCQRLYTQFSELGFQDETSVIKNYLKEIPLPDGIIYVESSTEKLIEQIFKRHSETGRLNHMHRNLCAKKLHLRCENYLKYANYAINYLSKLEVPILILNDTNREGSLKFINAFLKKI